MEKNLLAADARFDIIQHFILPEVTVSDEPNRDTSSLEQVKHQGKMQLVGKEHIIHDGDVVYFRFSA